jgi:glutathione S-transferase
VKLYWALGACSFMPHVVLEECGAPYEGVRVDPVAGDNQTDAYKKLNPRGHVPVLIDGELVLTEAQAISVYVAGKNPQAMLLPAPGTHEAARVLELGGILVSAFHQAYRQIRRPNRFTDDESAFPAIREKGHAVLTRLCAELDERIKGSAWGAGEQYTVVDPYLTICHKWAHVAEIELAPLKHWNAHSRRMFERPAVQRVFAQEGLVPWL